MDLKILAAKPVVDGMRANLIKRCDSLKKRGVVPSMSVVLVGDNPASLTYIRNKKKMCEEIGARFNLHQLPEKISERDFLSKISDLNNDNTTHGIIIQLPVSEDLKKLNIPNLVSPQKDIDGFHGINTQHIYTGSTNLNHLMPCTPKGIVLLLQHYGIELEGKNVVVIGRSLIVGKPLALLLSNFNATVTLAHSKTQDIEKHTRGADIVISAVGKAHYLSSGHFDPSAKTVVVDVGMNTLDGKLTGDVNQEEISKLVAAVSPVPGGVGPMTVACLIDNLIIATEQHLEGQI